MVKHEQDTTRPVEEFLAKGSLRLNGSRILIFIPARSEEHTIAGVVRGVREAGNFDVLVIDDRSEDATAEILRSLDVEVLTRRTNSDSRIINGLEIGYRLGYDYVVKIDGDGQHDPHDISRLYQHAVDTGADIVIGSRHHNGFKGNIRTIQGVGMWFCAWLATMLIGKHITDTTSGLKIWSRRACSVAIDAFQKGKLHEAATFHFEELLIGARKNLKLEEIPVTMSPREYGETKSFVRNELFKFPMNLVRSTLRGLF
ncbi:glycosyltransferase family 2 protein [Chloroflexota bacterium]